MSTTTSKAKPKVVHTDVEMFWTSEEDRDAFLAETARRKAAGESLEGLDLPIVLISGDDE